MLTFDELAKKVGPRTPIEIEHSGIESEVLDIESDRAVAVLGPAYLDTLLEDLLRVSLVEGESTEHLLAVDRPLGTFSARIDVAHALGFIDPTRPASDP